MTMTEEQTQSSSSKLTTPLAIVIAGGLVALAIYLRAPGNLGGIGATTGDEAGSSPSAENAVVDVRLRPVDSSDHVRGSQDARVTLVEYSDLECPFCKRFHTTLQQVMKEYPNDVRWVYRHFPLTSLHQQAQTEALASECAAEQGKFWEFIDVVFETTQGNDSLDLKSLPQLATKAGVGNISQFQSCLDGQKYLDRIQKDLADAEAAGGRGTPHTILIGPNDAKIPISGAQPFETLKAAIDSSLSAG